MGALAGFPVCVSVAELAPKFELPGYCAEMECVPDVSHEMGKFASPFSSVAIPTLELPFLNSTYPAGVPDDEETVAANVTNAPKGEGSSEEVSVTAVAKFTT